MNDSVRQQNLLQQIGGEDELRQLVQTFYDLVETLPEAHALHRLHFRGFGMAHVREEQFNFLSGFMGSRQLYLEKHGHMNLREMHAHVPIRESDAEIWLQVFDQALAARQLSGPAIDKLRAALRRVAFALINDVDDWRDS